MYDKIPIELWKRKDLKIMDPCGGDGNFHIVSVKQIQKYTNKSLEEIIGNNLYYNEINDIRFETYKKIFKINNIKLNTTKEDFLKMDTKEKYDIFTVNPPYAKLIYDEKTKKWKRASKNHNLIKSFIEKSLELLKPDGYLVYIIPDNWMSLADRNDLIKELTSYEFIWLNIGTAKKKWFKKVGSSFTWFILKKTKYEPKSEKKFMVEGIYKNYIYKSEVLLEKRSYIPLLYNKEVQSIFKKVIDKDNKKYKVETSSDLHKYTKKDLINNEKTKEFKYKLIHTPKQTVYANRKHKYQNGYKVFISTTDYYKVFVDNCGMTQSIAFIRCKNKKEAIKIQKILEHDLFLFINNLCRWGNFNNVRILQKFPIVNNPDKIYEEFNITKKEKLFIRKILNLNNNFNNICKKMKLKKIDENSDINNLDIDILDKVKYLGIQSILKYYNEYDNLD